MTLENLVILLAVVVAFLFVIKHITDAMFVPDKHCQGKNGLSGSDRAPSGGPFRSAGEVKPVDNPIEALFNKGAKETREYLNSPGPVPPPEKKPDWDIKIANGVIKITDPKGVSWYSDHAFFWHTAEGTEAGLGYGNKLTGKYKAWKLTRRFGR